MLDFLEHPALSGAGALLTILASIVALVKFVRDRIQKSGGPRPRGVDPAAETARTETLSLLSALPYAIVGLYVAILAVGEAVLLKALFVTHPFDISTFNTRLVLIAATGAPQSLGLVTQFGLMYLEESGLCDNTESEFSRFDTFILIFAVPGLVCFFATIATIAIYDWTH
ncbi:MAG: hypothetical protein K0U98_05215 [Deltaproteobacteria bacterium]|nr:hypothetical protein [Deltaproteobacteria bacterium]